MANVKGTDTIGDCSTDAGYRTFVNSLHDALIAAGFVQTADTGQIADRATVTAPTSDALTNYEVFRFNDALQSTSPFFFKVRFARHLTLPALSIIVGDATDGAGTLSNSVTQQHDYSNAGGNAYWTGDQDEGRFIWLCTSGQYGPVLILERLRDADGTPNGKGVFVYCGTRWNANPIVGVYAPLKTYRFFHIVQTGATIPVLAPASNSGYTIEPTTSVRGVLGITPVAFTIQPPCIGAWFFGSDLTRAADVDADIQIYGRTRNYKHFTDAKAPRPVQGVGSDGASGLRLAILWAP